MLNKKKRKNLSMLRR